MSNPKATGARIRSELNDLKRTPESCAQELGIPLEIVEKILSGQATSSETSDFIDTLGHHYPIDKSDLVLLQDDCLDGVRLMRSDESLSSARIFQRKDRHGDRTPYYEYRDTAMSRLAPFRPEWIEEKRVVADADPNNPDVAYNNGHMLHQMTFFVGPVNFYYKAGGQAHCCQMNTGDSNYIMPFYPHSFTSRDPNQQALIIAVTFGGDVRRAQKELYALGERGERYHRDFRNRPPRLGLLELHLENARLTPEALAELLEDSGAKLSAEKALAPDSSLSAEETLELAQVLRIHPSDLMCPDFSAGDDVKVVYRRDSKSYAYPSRAQSHYLIHPLAQHQAMPLVRSFAVEVVGTEQNPDAGFTTGLHTYLYNYGASPITFIWSMGESTHQETLMPGDSAYVQPFVVHSFLANSKPGHLLLVSLPGFVGLSAQKEFSYFESASRVVRETKRWFD